MEKLFKLKENKTTVRTEIVAGLTTFMTMAYIIALNPNLLTGFGAEGQDLWNGVFLATCIASAIGTFCMAFLANKPFAMAPGMGLNSFFAVVVANIVAITGTSYLESFQAALVLILVEGIVFVLLSIFNVREKIVKAIPLGVRLGIGPSIGLMLMNIGFGSNAGIYSETGGPFFAMRDFFGALTAKSAKDAMGSGYPAMVLSVVTMFVGLFIIVALDHHKVKGSVLYGMLGGSVIYWAGQAIFLHTNPFASLATASFVPPFADMAKTTLFKILAGEMEPDEGSYKWGLTTSQAYFPKDNSKEFENEDTIAEWLTQYSPVKDATYVRGFLGRMLFAGEDGVKKVKVLSGGEKVRCMLSRMMLYGSNVLILDQPTNHLDLESITAVNNGLAAFKGNVIFASHDHEFMNTIANRIIRINPDGSITDRMCTYDEYLEKVKNGEL